MTVTELIDMLKGLTPDAQIVIAGDEEGNNFGNIDSLFGEGFGKNNQQIYALYPLNKESSVEEL